MENIINLNLKFLKNASLCVAKDEIRFYLQGIHIFDKDGKRTYEATDGKILYKATETIIGKCLEKEIILTGDLKNLKKIKLENTDYISLDIFEELYILNRNYIYKNIDASFPDTNKVIPDKQLLKPLTVYRKFEIDCLTKLKQIIPSYELNEAENNIPCVAFCNNEIVVIMPIN